MYGKVELSDNLLNTICKLPFEQKKLLTTSYMTQLIKEVHDKHSKNQDANAKLGLEELNESINSLKKTVKDTVAPTLTKLSK